MIASQPQITSRPVQVRCSNHPIGLRSNFRPTQPRKKLSQTKGVQNVFSNQSCRFEGGSSCQERRILFPAIKTATARTTQEKAVTCAMAQSNWLGELNRR